MQLDKSLHAGLQNKLYHKVSAYWQVPAAASQGEIGISLRLKVCKSMAFATLRRFSSWPGPGCQRSGVPTCTNRSGPQQSWSIKSSKVLSWIWQILHIKRAKAGGLEIKIERGRSKLIMAYLQLFGNVYPDRIVILGNALLVLFPASSCGVLIFCLWLPAFPLLRLLLTHPSIHYHITSHHPASHILIPQASHTWQHHTSSQLMGALVAAALLRCKHCRFHWLRHTRHILRTFEAAAVTVVFCVASRPSSVWNPPAPKAPRHNL